MESTVEEALPRVLGPNLVVIKIIKKFSDGSGVEKKQIPVSTCV